MIHAALNVINSTYSTQEMKDLELPTHHYSITVNNFKDEAEANIILAKIKEMIKNWQGMRKVY